MSRLRAVVEDAISRLEGYPDSQLDGEDGLAAATMRDRARLERERDRLRRELETLREAMRAHYDVVMDAESHSVSCEWADRIDAILRGES
jgi:hypothetical protein